MLGNFPFYHQTIKKIVTIFGTIFNDISIVRTNAITQEVERIKTPISYGPSEKYLTRLHQDPTLQRPISIQVPRMSFRISDIRYDGARKRNKIREHVKVKDDSNLYRVFDGVPYIIGMELTIISKNQDDANQILEQIIPYFSPDFTPTYNPISTMDFKEDLPIILNNITYTDNYTDDWRTRREILYTLGFNILAYFYPPVKEQGVITKAQVDIHLAPGDGPVTDEEVQKTPRHIRITTTPDPITADADDDFGYTEAIEEFDDGKKYDGSSDTDIDIP